MSVVCDVPREADVSAEAVEQPLPDVRVLVLSDLPLVADAVRTALRSQGLDAVGATIAPGPVSQGQAARMLQLGPTVLLVLADLAREPRLAAARTLIEDLHLPTVVLAATEEEALWGAVLESGASTVLPASVTLDEVVLVLRAVERGALLLAPDQRRSMIDTWHQAVRTRDEIGGRIGSLSPRELEVLRLLYRGETVPGIAEQLGVAVATVRSQVRSVLRKLGVNSQLGAVALYAQRGSTGGSTGGSAGGSTGTRPDGDPT
jgi:DNA-binding NarL/FixJ family response regulator